MSSVLLHWTTRGKKSDSNEPLASITMDLDEIKKNSKRETAGPVHPDMPITQALQILTRDRGIYAPDIEYGCFNHDGTLIKNSFLLRSRRRRNILYYMIRKLYNISRGLKGEDAGLMGMRDAVPFSPENNWAVLMSENCLYKRDIERAVEPLVKHRGGKILTIPKLTVDTKGSKEWVERCAKEDFLPKYLLICDSFENIELEFQFILNAFSVTGRTALYL
jgi:hypothetical protein